MNGIVVFDPALSEDALWERMLSAFASRIGATSALYGFLPSLFWLEEGLLSRSVIFRHDHPAEVLGDANPESLLDDDPSALRLKTGEQWFFWDDATNWEGSSPAQVRRFASGSPAANVGVSIRMPFFEGRAVAGLGLCALHCSAEQFRALWLTKLDENLALAQAFDAVMRPRMIANRFKLTKREVSVMRLLACGLSAKSCAEHLGLQPKTVFNVMDRARKSLGAETTLEAVTKAMAFSLI